MQASVPSLVEMMIELVGTPSVSSTSPGWDQSNLAVIEMLEGWLSTLGFATEILPVPGFPGKANLIATLGSGPGGLVLAGHTDTVPYDEGRWQSDPFKLTERDNRLYGLGSCDMKAFFAIAIEAAREFLDKPLKQPLIILATADEETGMCGARAIADLGRPKARAAVIGEPTSLSPVYMHKGVTFQRIKLTGQAGHSSNPALGNSAMEAMHRVMSEMLQFRGEMQRKYQNEAFKVTLPTLNLGCIHGGDSPNRICGQCQLDYDLRTLPGMNNQEVVGQISERLKPIAEDLGVKLEFEELFHGIPPFQNSADSELVKTAEALTGHQGETVAFGTEGPFLQSMGIDTVVMGPGSIDQAHQPNEYLPMEQIQPTIKVLNQLIRRYCL